MSDIVVGEATSDDWQVWRDLRLRALQDSPGAFGSTYERESAFTEADWRRRAGGAGDATDLAVGSPGPAVIATLDGEPVGIGGGYIDLPGWLHIVAMWTAPEARGQGIGRAVLDFLVRWAHDRNLRVHLDVEAGNAGARRAYERAGFVVTGESRPLRDGSVQSCERMVLPAG